MKLDEVDICILRALQENARMSLSELARRSGVSLSTVHWRLKKLVSSGIVEGFSARVNHAELGFGVTAFVRLRTQFLDDIDKTVNDLRSIPEVEEMHIVAGEFDLLVKVRAADTKHLQRVLVDVHHATGYIRSCTEICLSSPMERVAPLVGSEPRR